MKYLISLLLMFVLWGCNGLSPVSQNSAEVKSDSSVSRNAIRYLDGPIKGMVNQRGLYRLVRSGGLIDNSSTSTGKAVVSPVIQLVTATERIPLIKGAQLYLQYRLWYLPDRPAYIDLRRVLKHPEMKLPDGSVATGSDYMLKQRVSVNQAIGYTGYGLDEDYELVEGDWVFEIWYQGEKLIEQKFTTYWPSKEEIATLTPVLTLGNDVLTKVKLPGKSGSGHSWPRVIVGEKEIAESAALLEMKRVIDDSSN